MKFTILGAGSGLPHPDFHLSSVVVQTKDYNILLDCGEGTSRQLIKNGFNHDFLDAVLISHYHPDHVSGLFMLIQMLYLENRTKPLNLFLPERPSAFMESMHLFYTFENRLPYKLHVFEMPEIKSHYPEIIASLTDHLLGYGDFLKKNNYPNQMRSYCFAVEDGSKTLLYTSDISSLNSIRSLLDKADVVIIDALHPEAEQIIQLAEDSVKQLILTHGISDSLKRWTDKNSLDNIQVAKESHTMPL